MALQPGTQLGAYKILGPLGAGGMGEVYRATDTRLNRDVAIKVLPASFANDEDRLRRFEQEARATSALNHPNILTVYDIGAHEDAPYIVAELLEGEELRDQLNDGALAPRKAIDYAVQIAAGLAASHGKGITHRDLKPENLFITTDGRVKILDFGLAKLRPQRIESAGSGVATQKATTDAGTVMGTVGYMSPEQVRGQEADHRSDIFSFGVILYEMLSGKRTFTGDSTIEVMNAILKEDPAELSVTNARINPALEKIVQRCLEKKPERRFQTASDLGFAIESLSAFSNSSGANRTEMLTAQGTSAMTTFGGWRERIAWTMAGILAVIALTLGVARFRRPAEETRAVHLSLIPPKEMSYTTAIRDHFTLSPDGTKLVFTGSGTDGRFHLWVRPLDSRDAKPLPGTEDANVHFWSPDSRALVFATRGKLKRIDLANGRVQTLCEGELQAGSWSRNGVILFNSVLRQGLFQIPETGGEPKLVTRPGSNPYFLPDGRHFLYQQGTSGIFVGSLDSAEGKQLPAEGRMAKYAPPGWLLYTQDGSLLAQRFDAESLELKGEPTPIVKQISILWEIYSVSETGVLVWRENSNRRQLVWFDRAGKQGDTVGPPISDSGQHPVLSPDGKRAVLQRLDEQITNNDIWVMQLSQNLLTRITSNRRSELLPAWSPDGSHVIYLAARGADSGLYQKAASGIGNEELLLKGVILSANWSADGRFIVYASRNDRINLGISVLPLFGDRQPYPIIETEFNEGECELSHDGRWLVYTSDESGSNEIYVQPFTPEGKAGSGKWRISTNGGDQPRFRRDGKELFYIAADNTLMSVAVKSNSETFETNAPQSLFRTRLASQGTLTRADYEVTPDGQRFLLNMLVGETGAPAFNVTLNWTADLKK